MRAPTPPDTETPDLNPGVQSNQDPGVNRPPPPQSPHVPQGCPGWETRLQRKAVFLSGVNRWRWACRTCVLQLHD